MYGFAVHMTMHRRLRLHKNRNIKWVLNKFFHLVIKMKRPPRCTSGFIPRSCIYI